MMKRSFGHLIKFFIVFSDFVDNKLTFPQQCVSQLATNFASFSSLHIQISFLYLFFPYLVPCAMSLIDSKYCDGNHKTISLGLINTYVHNDTVDMNHKQLKVTVVGSQLMIVGMCALILMVVLTSVFLYLNIAHTLWSYFILVLLYNDSHFPVVIHHMY